MDRACAAGKLEICEPRKHGEVFGLCEPRMRGGQGQEYVGRASAAAKVKFRAGAEKGSHDSMTS